ncbi:type VII secretion system-associated protein, partial [Streptomyces sp. NPDC057654]|uniref:type VII secretion system-associated protein n=1 Tax=Streptomyces sp. NPDC057654 TaxID=3346196 RepID=UPI00369C4A84
ESARSAPDQWFGMIDPAWSGAGAPPVWAMAGEWRSGSRGEVVEWRDNEQYRPSLAALGWAGPKDPVDAALQLAATGYCRADAVTRQPASAEEPGMLREAVEAVGAVNEEDGWRGALDDILPVVRPGSPADGGTPQGSAEELS